MRKDAWKHSSEPYDILEEMRQNTIQKIKASGKTVPPLLENASTYKESQPRREDEVGKDVLLFKEKWYMSEKHFQQFEEAMERKPEPGKGKHPVRFVSNQTLMGKTVSILKYAARKQSDPIDLYLYIPFKNNCGRFFHCGIPGNSYHEKSNFDWFKMLDGSCTVALAIFSTTQEKQKITA